MDPCARCWTLSDYPSALPRAGSAGSIRLGLLLLCLVQYVLASPARAEPSKLSLGFIAGGRFGSGSTEEEAVTVWDAPAETIKRASHWLLGGEIAQRGETRFFGLRTSFSYYKAADDDRNTLFRFGPFLGGTFFKRPIGPVTLGLFGEGSLYLDTRLWTGPSLGDGVGRGFAFVPGVGVGIELALLGALRVNLYGGVNYTASLSELDSYWGGEIRTAALYVFGERLTRLRQHTQLQP
jgi:hypothetical protein